MDVVEALLAKNLLPVLKHTNDTYRLVEQEGRRAAMGLLHQKANVQVVVVHSRHSNAYAFASENYYIIAVTDTLMQRLEETVKSYLKDERIRQFIAASTGIEYDISDPFPAAMTWGSRPDSQRSRIAYDHATALFYEIIDSAWFFSVLHEVGHIDNGDADPINARPNVAADAYGVIMESFEIESYGGYGPNARKRHSEYSADRSASCWITQILLEKYVDSLSEPDPFAMAHILLSVFGIIAAVMLIAHHVPDTTQAMNLHNHPSFEIRLAGVWKGLEIVLNDPDMRRNPVGVLRIMRVLTELRAMMETVSLGAPSGYDANSRSIMTISDD